MTTVKTTYTAITRNRSQWTTDADGNVCYEKTWECGHKHQTPEAAAKCIEKMGNAACSFRAEVEDNNGSRVDGDGYPLL